MQNSNFASMLIENSSFINNNEFTSQYSMIYLDIPDFNATI